jgi:regulator of PEP synthase PpsR (kinase-PPPase family)
VVHWASFSLGLLKSSLKKKKKPTRWHWPCTTQRLKQTIRKHIKQIKLKTCKLIHPPIPTIENSSGAKETTRTSQKRKTRATNLQPNNNKKKTQDALNPI